MRNPLLRQRCLCPLALLLAGPALSPWAFAADAINHLNVQEPSRPAYLPGASAGSLRLPPVTGRSTGSAMAGGESLFIKRIAFTGNTVIATSELEVISAPYVGHQIDEGDIETLRQTLSRHYVDQGYVNSGAKVGPGAFVDGTLTFEIMEGRLNTLELRGLERLSERYVASRLIKNDQEVLNINLLHERFQRLLDDPLFTRMNARLAPGTRLGEAILDIDIVRALPYQFSVFSNNYRPPSIGPNALGISGWIRNLTGYGDYLEASLQNSFPERESPRAAVAWRMPLNQMGTQFSIAAERGRSSVIEEPVAVLDIKSRLDTTDLGLSQTIVETLRHTLSLGVNRVWRKNRTTLLNEAFSFTPGEPDGVTKVAAWRFWQEYSHRSEKQVLALRSTFSSARNNLIDINGLPPGGSFQPEKEYSLWLGQAHYAKQLGSNGTQLVLRGSIQQSPDLLLPLDRMSIGGVYTVRGYRENQLITDNGSILNVELDFPLLRNPGKELNIALVPFHDWGRGRNQGAASTILSSAGFATRLRWQGFALDLAIAKRLKHPDSLIRAGNTLQDHGIHCQLTYNFF